MHMDTEAVRGLCGKIIFCYKCMAYIWRTFFLASTLSCTFCGTGKPIVYYICILPGKIRDRYLWLLSRPVLLLIPNGIYKDWTFIEEFWKESFAMFLQLGCTACYVCVIQHILYGASNLIKENRENLSILFQRWLMNCTDIFPGSHSLLYFLWNSVTYCAQYLHFDWKNEGWKIINF